MFSSSLPPIVCRRAHVLFTLFVFVCSCALHILCCVLVFFVLCLVYDGVQHILYCVFALFVFVLFLLYTMFPASLDCPFLTVSSVFSNVYLITLSIACFVY
jgi:hypothetical protein